MDSQRTLLAKRDQYAEQAERHERRVEIAEALEAERMAGECLFEVLQLAQKVGEAQWEELQATKGELREVKDERDALAAELVALRAGLPRWKRASWAQWILRTQQQQIAAVSLDGDGWTNWVGGTVVRHDTREAAMLAVTTALGLPPCEVEGE